MPSKAGDGRQQQRALRVSFSRLPPRSKSVVLEDCLQRPYLVADRAMGDVEFARRGRNGAAPGGCLEGAQGVERGQAVALWLYRNV